MIEPVARLLATTPWGADAQVRAQLAARASWRLLAPGEPLPAAAPGGWQAILFGGAAPGDAAVAGAEGAVLVRLGSRDLPRLKAVDRWPRWPQALAIFLGLPLVAVPTLYLRFLVDAVAADGLGAAGRSLLLVVGLALASLVPLLRSPLWPAATVGRLLLALPGLGLLLVTSPWLATALLGVLSLSIWHRRATAGLGAWAIGLLALGQWQAGLIGPGVGAVALALWRWLQPIAWPVTPATITPASKLAAWAHVPLILFWLLPGLASASQSTSLSGYTPPVGAAGAVAAEAASSLPMAGLEEPQLTPLSLDAVVELALQHNYGIRTAFLGLVPLRFAVDVARNRFQPRLGTDASLGQAWVHGPQTAPAELQPVRGQSLDLRPHAELTLPTGTRLSLDLQAGLNRPAFSFGRQMNTALSLELSQPLLRDLGPRVNLAPLRGAELARALGRLQVKNAVIQTVFNVILAYRALVQSVRVLEITQKGLERARELLKLNYELVSAGRIAQADLIQIEADIATREANRTQTRSNVVDAQVGLLRLLSLNIDASIGPIFEAVPPLPALNRALEQARALAHRPDYVGGLRGLDLARQTLISAENSRRWDLRLAAYHRRGGLGERTGRVLADAAVGPSHLTFVGLTLSIPLVDILLRQQVLNSQVGVQLAATGLAQIGNSVGLDVDDALRTLSLRRHRYELAQRARDLNEKKLNNEREKLSAGRSFNFQVLRFVDDLVNAEVTLLTSALAYLNALSGLEVATGTLLDRWQIQFE